MARHSNVHIPLRWGRRRIDMQKQPIKILVVDDFETGALAMMDYLSLEDMDCRTAASGTEAVAVGVAWSPDIILMDISMPKFSGFQAARAVRSNVLTRNTVIIAFTALSAEQVRRDIVDDEFDGYFQKGQSPDGLLAFIKTITS